MSSRTILKDGLKGLRRFLEQSPNVAATPILLIQSRPQYGTHSKSVEKVCQEVDFLLTKQLGLRAIISQHDYALPTQHNIDQQLELASRVGATTVVAVGSGATIDLAKATVQSTSNMDELILVPATYGATMVSTASHSLLLDPLEEEIVVSPLTHELKRNVPTSVAVIEADKLDPQGRNNAVFAAIALAMDGILRGKKDPAIESLLASDSWSDKAPTDVIQGQLLDIGTFISYGLGEEDRSIPLALAASLLPNHFAQDKAVDFMASLAPLLYRLARSTEPNMLESRLQEESLHDAPKVLTTESFENLLSSIHANQTLWNCFDARDNVLRQVLQDLTLT
jgi:hypothetical protein